MNKRIISNKLYSLESPSLDIEKQTKKIFFNIQLSKNRAGELIKKNKISSKILKPLASNPDKLHITSKTPTFKISKIERFDLSIYEKFKSKF